MQVFLSETLATTFVVDDKLDHAVIVKDASFVWEKSSSSLDSSKGSKRSRRADASITVAEEQTEPSGIYDINLVVPRGQLLCVVGSVGAGKSSLLQGLIGEMRKTQGEVVFGASQVMCCPCVVGLTHSCLCRWITELLRSDTLGSERYAARQHHLWPALRRETACRIFFLPCASR